MAAESSNVLVYSIAVCIEALVESGASGEGSDAAILKAAAIRGSVLGISFDRKVRVAQLSG